MVLGFQDNSFHLHFAFMFWLRYYKMVPSLYQKPTPGLKNHMRNLDNYRQAVESPKSWNLMGYFCPKKKNIPSAQTYIADLSNITFNFLYQNSPNDLCHFWNHMLFFTTQPLYILEWRFSDLSLLTLKFTKFLMSFLKPRVNFSSNFASLFIVMRQNFSEIF